MPSELEEKLFFQMHCAGLDHSVTREHHFARELIGNPTKGIRQALKSAGLCDWRFDFAFKHQKLAVEVEGGTFTGGRHTRGKGFESDCDKYNAATLGGWRILRFTAKHIKTGEALMLIEKGVYHES